MAPYRPPGRSNRSGRTQADNDVFEGLPVKQWTHATTRVSLVPPTSQAPGVQTHDKWAEPPMPRDWQLLQPWTQQLLRLARSGKLGQKRKATRDADDADGEDYGAREDDHSNNNNNNNNHNNNTISGDESNNLGKGSILDADHGFVAKKWRHVPDHALVPEHLHLEFLARSRKGLPSFYHNLNTEIYGAPPALRKTRVSRLLDLDTGDVAVYEILIMEGQPLENEVIEGSEHFSKELTVLTAGSTIEGLGTANADGVLVADARSSAGIAQRRNRPPPKKKGGPGRGKKRVTFTNPDGSTYTTIVPNATKIVPQPGQTVKHVAKGEEAARDITAEEAASMKPTTDMEPGEGDEEGDDDEDGDEEGDEGDDREDGELVEEDAETQNGTTKESGTPQAQISATDNELDKPMIDAADAADAEANAVQPVSTTAKTSSDDDEPSASAEVPIEDNKDEPTIAEASVQADNNDIEMTGIDESTLPVVEVVEEPAIALDDVEPSDHAAEIATEDAIEDAREDVIENTAEGTPDEPTENASDNVSEDAEHIEATTTAPAEAKGTEEVDDTKKDDIEEDEERELAESL